MTSWIIELSTH